MSLLHTYGFLNSGLQVVVGPSPGKGGRTPDPFIGLAPEVNPEFVVAAGCRNSASTYGSRRDAYVGVRSFPEFGGHGAAKSRGTLAEGVSWSREWSSHFLSRVNNANMWNGPDLQWTMWRLIPNSAENDSYIDTVCEAIAELAIDIWGQNR